MSAWLRHLLEVLPRKRSRKRKLKSVFAFFSLVFKVVIVVAGNSRSIGPSVQSTWHPTKTRRLDLAPAPLPGVEELCPVEAPLIDAEAPGHEALRDPAGFEPKADGCPCH